MVCAQLGLDRAGIIDGYSDIQLGTHFVSCSNDVDNTIYTQSFGIIQIDFLSACLLKKPSYLS